MATRVHRIGTIYSRLDGLLRKGLIKESDRPLWFDVYKSFPPKYIPTHKRETSDTQLRVILYEEDILRAKIHKIFAGQLGLIDLNGKSQLFCETLVKTCQQYIAEGLSENDAIEKLKNIVEDFHTPKDKGTNEDVADVQRALSEIF